MTDGGSSDRALKKLGVEGCVRRRHGWLVVAVFLVCAGAATAQDEPPVSGLFSGSVRVDVVNLEVFVTDGDGDPVFGLTRDDFELVVDGRVMEISNFRPPPNPGADAARKIPEKEVSDEPAPPRHLAVFVDRSNFLPDRRAEIMASLRQFLGARRAAGDLVMVAAYDAKLEVLSPFGDDNAGLERALGTLDRTSSSAFDSRAEFNRILRCLEVTCQMPEYLWDSVRIYAREERFKSRKMLAHFGAFIDSLAALPGRRSVLFVSDGIAVRPGESLFAAYQQYFNWVEHYGPIEYSIEANRYSLTGDLEELTDLANERRVTIYSLNGGGIIGNRYATQAVAVAGSQLVDNEIDFIREANYLGSLERFSGATGGRTVFKPTDETLADVRQDLESGYSLGFNPDHQPDNRSRSIAVRVHADGVKVRHRRNYRLATDEDRNAEAARRALLTAETDNPLFVEVDFSPHASRQSRKHVVSASVKVPLRGLALVPGEGSRLQGEVEITLLLEDEDGNLTPIQKDSLPLDLPAGVSIDEGPGHITYEVGLRVRAGSHRLAMTVADTLGTRVSTLTWDLEVADDGRVTTTP